MTEMSFFGHLELLDYYGLRETAKTAKTATKLSYGQKYKI
jgi:hypothetical protein